MLINNEWMKDIHEADAIIVATHSQGSVVSTHLLDRLISDKHIRTHVEQVELSGGETFPSSVGVSFSPTRKPQRVCCLALCGIHLGPLRYLSSSSLLQPYFQVYFILSWLLLLDLTPLSSTLSLLLHANCSSSRRVFTITSQSFVLI